PPDNATGNFNKVVQRIPVRIAIDSSPPKNIAIPTKLNQSMLLMSE
ncbi:hypothetical protein AB0861_026620, partial [Acinetobacter baumannii]